MRGYMDALAGERIRTVLIFISAEVTSPVRYVERRTGNLIVVLPTTATYRWLRTHVPSYRTMLKSSADKGFGVAVGRTAGSLAAYVSTPWRALERELKLHGCEAVLAQEYEFFRFDVLVAIAKRLGSSVFGVFQGSSFEPNVFSRAWKRAVLPRADGLLIASGDEVDRVRRTYGNRVQVRQVFNPLDLSLWNDHDRNAARSEAGAANDTCLVVWHGRTAIYDKGLDVLLSAWRRVRRERPGLDLRLMLMGSGEDADEFRSMLNEASDDTIRWIDRYATNQEDVRRFLAAGDIYAFPSRREGFAVAPLEGMACGLPVVAAQASGVSDILRGEADGGVTVPTANASAFAQALGSLVDDEGRRRRLGHAARLRVASAFSLEQVGRELRAALMNGKER
jgi:starch synthase